MLVLVCVCECMCVDELMKVAEPKSQLAIASWGIESRLAFRIGKQKAV